MAEVRFSDVEKIYPGDVLAATDINLKVNDRELLVLVGPSGCGKSTVLRMVAGLEDVTSGDIYFDGEVVTDLSPKDRDIAMVFQNYALYPHMSVYENMAFGLKLRKYPKEEIESRVSEAADILGIEKLLKRKPKALSGGQRQRVALGRAIVRKPSVFLFDEPLSNLDAKMRVQMRTEIRKLNLSIKTTMIYVTHDQVEAMTLGDRLAVMHEGRIMQVGTPIDLYNRPANRFVGSFIGSPAMNFIEGKVSDGSTPSILTPSGEIPLRDELAAKTAGMSGRPLTLGIRPEDLYADDPSPREGSFHPLPAKVEVSETLGNEVILHIDCGGCKFVAREEPERNAPHGTDIDLYFDLQKVHLFDVESGEAF